MKKEALKKLDRVHDLTWYMTKQAAALEAVISETKCEVTPEDCDKIIKHLIDFYSNINEISKNTLDVVDLVLKAKLKQE